jgi:hypothetical protein
MEADPGGAVLKRSVEVLDQRVRSVAGSGVA